MEQIKELCNSEYTESKWTTLNGVTGCKITSRSNGKSIFLPAAGCVSQNDSYSDPSQAGSFGYYWGRSLCSYNTQYADYLEVSPNRTDGSSYYRNYGQSIRPVLNGANTVQLVTDITLNCTSLSLKLSETMTLKATVLPDDADDIEVEWTSSDEAVATVSADGLVTGVALGTCVITCSATDGSGVKAECQVRVVTDTHGTTGGHEWVDLGLPSGTLWATCNVGASSPEKYGNHFAWGGTESEDTYDFTTYKWCEGSAKTMTKYCTESEYGYNGFTDNLTELLPEDDAATANWGRNWQMPSDEQIKELINSEYTTTKWTTQNGVNGCKITSKSNSNSIFLPAAGYRFHTELSSAGSAGRYWACSLSTNYSSYACNLIFDSEDISWGDSPRFSGFSVRPVVRTKETYTVNGVSVKMIPVEGGTFQMGSDDSDANDDQKPVHQVTLSSFSIGETEVTQELWYAVMGAKPTSSNSWSTTRGLGNNYPAYYVSWNDCQTFITKLNQMTGKKFRLPTEAEWEYAARGGNKSNGYKYSGSNTIEDVAWYNSNSNMYTHPVATKAPNELGIYDMSGNVYEWCQDWYGEYSSGSQTNPTGPSSGSNRVERGGGWNIDARDCRVSLRDYVNPTKSYSNLGFRLAL